MEGPCLCFPITLLGAVGPVGLVGPGHNASGRFGVNW